jgi:hypothetical protein
MATKATASVASLEHVWGSLVDLLKQLTRLSKALADQAEKEAHPMQERKL